MSHTVIEHLPNNDLRVIKSDLRFRSADRMRATMEAEGRRVSIIDENAVPADVAHASAALLSAWASQESKRQKAARKSMPASRMAPTLRVRVPLALLPSSKAPLRVTSGEVRSGLSFEVYMPVVAK